MIAYRIQQPEHPTAWLLDPERQHSTNWSDDEDVRDGVSACSTDVPMTLAASRRRAISW